MDDYQLLKKIGEGSYGVVYLVRSKKTGGMSVIKKVSLKDMSEKERKKVHKEARILQMLHHPNIVSYYDSFEDPETGSFCLVMEYVSGGDLRMKIKEKQDQGEYFTEEEIYTILIQLISGLKEIQDHKIIHRDLKSANIFISKKGLLKIGDFGISRILSNTYEKAKTLIGTPYYISPEILENKPYSFQSDIWSLGVVIYEICHLKRPFESDNIYGLVLKILNSEPPSLPSFYAKDLQDFILSFLQKDPQKRPTITQAYESPFIQSLSQKYTSSIMFKINLSNAFNKNPDSHHNPKSNQRSHKNVFKTKSNRKKFHQTLSPVHVVKMNDLQNSKPISQFHSENHKLRNQRALRPIDINSNYPNYPNYSNQSKNTNYQNLPKFQNKFQNKFQSEMKPKITTNHYLINQGVEPRLSIINDSTENFHNMTNSQSELSIPRSHLSPYYNQQHNYNSPILQEETRLSSSISFLKPIQIYQDQNPSPYINSYQKESPENKEKEQKLQIQQIQVKDRERLFRINSYLEKKEKMVGKKQKNHLPKILFSEQKDEQMEKFSGEKKSIKNFPSEILDQTSLSPDESIHNKFDKIRYFIESQIGSDLFSQVHQKIFDYQKYQNSENFSEQNEFLSEISKLMDGKFDWIPLIERLVRCEIFANQQMNMDIFK
ncbi:camk family protein kinase [Anaeramoeba ignava]|uniref:non-specific serine/threonine protein kinase n=1 Tax=Anaeramoeba ignava TaxID=1746090 RepID=A0A9Q0LHE5_ANAIG|nr:camk family protein kinase [Anaeramoeba ignava]